IDRAVDKTRDEAQAGVVCLVCHSIDATSLAGNGQYHAHFSTVPPPGAEHGARLRPALLGTSELCAACHKVALTEAVTGERWLRGDDEQLARTKERLRGTVSLDLAWVEPGAVADVVLRSRGVGHRFPGGTMDSNEAWIALEALAGDGRLLGQSGALDGNGDV